ncbi:MAG: 5-(carboxyamino)imidazole ribonucleotide mutase [Ignavibacteria bacterium]|nr:5-(carboxyamino)imidazole ribonucleotide mutase [Ignavibacteria bacterium]
MMAAKPVVGIIMGSDSDLPVMEKAFDVCKEFSVPFEVRIISAHRTPLVMKEYAETAIKRGLNVIIAGAGGAAHLAGVAASFTTLPIIGVPVQRKSLNGLDSLLSMVQMPPGVPVATVAIDGAKNAALLAIQILALHDKVLAKKFSDYKVKMEKEVIAKDKAVSKKL